MNKLLKEGYEVVVGGRALTILNRDLGHGIAGRKHTFNAPNDYTPGRYDDMSKGYHAGSYIINERKEVFLCVDETEGKANWIIMGSLEELATKNSFVRNQDEPEPQPVVSTANGSGARPGPQQEPDPPPVSEDPYPESEGMGSEPVAQGPIPEETEETAQIQAEAEQTKTEHLDKDSTDEELMMGAQSGPNRGHTPIPDEMPWGKYCRKNGLEYIEDVRSAISDGSLVGMSYMNADRVEAIREWLDQ